eukprot:scaffold2736_cov94-Isochrysis_galbana.AAC.1
MMLARLLQRSCRAAPLARCPAGMPCTSLQRGRGFCAAAKPPSPGGSDADKTAGAAPPLATGRLVWSGWCGGPVGQAAPPCPQRIAHSPARRVHARPPSHRRWQGRRRTLGRCCFRRVDGSDIGRLPEPRAGRAGRVQRRRGQPAAPQVRGGARRCAFPFWKSALLE